MITGAGGNDVLAARSPSTRSSAGSATTSCYGGMNEDFLSGGPGRDYCNGGGPGHDRDKKSCEKTVDLP